MTSWNGVEFKPLAPVIGNVALHEAETKLGLNFPADYAEFLLAVNGGVPPKADIPLCGSDEQVSVKLLFVLSDCSVRFSLLAEHSTTIDRTDDGLPDGFLTIGIDPGGAPYFLSTRGSTSGNVYIFDPDGFLDKDRVPRLHHVATSFTDLVERIRQAV